MDDMPFRIVLLVTFSFSLSLDLLSMSKPEPDLIYSDEGSSPSRPFTFISVGE
jgi:hypothetical protein